MASEEVDEVKNEEASEVVSNEVNEEANEALPDEVKPEQNEEVVKKENDEVIEVEPTPKAKPKATPKKLARTVKVVELVECEACNKKMLPKSLRNTHPQYCKGQPRETLPVNKQKASYGSKVEQKLRKEIEEEMKAKYEKENDKNAQNVKNEVIQYSQPIEAKTKAKPIRMEREETPPPPRQLSATELLQQHYSEIRKAKQQQKVEQINRFKSSMF